MISKRSLHQLFNNDTNACQLQQRINEAIHRSQLTGQNFALIFLDLGHFNEINICQNHDIGDQLLVSVARRIRHQLKEKDTLCHFGGDKFVLLLESTDQQSVTSYANNLLHQLHQPYPVTSEGIILSSYLGITLNNQQQSAINLLKEAEIALQKAKSAGHNSFYFYSNHLLEPLLQQHQVRIALHHALTKKEFWLAYQPQIEVNSCGFIGAETLLRWDHATLNNPPPDVFIPLAEQSDLILKIGDWVIDQALWQLKCWSDEQVNCGTLAVNVSPRQFWSGDFARNLLQKIETAQVNPEQLEIEITEGLAMRNPAQSIRIMHELTDAGLKLAIDDFGTGHSSLAYLKDLPAGKLKIDKSFIQSVGLHSQSEQIIQSIVQLAGDMGKAVVAEGVETLQQHDFLSSINCTYAQGYLYGRPMQLDRFNDWQKNTSLRPAP